MGTKERRTRERHETRDLILSAARDMFAQDGYDAVTMRAIAERIEYTPTALYHHFENKQALLSELCQRDFEGLARHFQGQATATDPVERILAVGEAYLRFAEQYPSQYRFMFMTVLPRPAHDERYIAESRDNPERNAYAFLRDACRAAIDAGRMRPEIDDPDLYAQMLWGAVHGLISLRIAKQHSDWVPWRELRVTARLTMRALMRGLLREPGALA